MVAPNKQHPSCDGCAVQYKSGHDSLCLKCTDDYINWCSFTPMKDKPKLWEVGEKTKETERKSIFRKIIDWLSIEADAAYKIKKEQEERFKKIVALKSMVEEAKKVRSDNYGGRVGFTHSGELYESRGDRAEEEMRRKMDKIDW